MEIVMDCVNTDYSMTAKSHRHRDVQYRTFLHNHYSRLSRFFPPTALASEYKFYQLASGFAIRYQLFTL